MSLTRREWWVVAGLLVVGCLSPTLPLPPPSRPTVYGPDESGNVTLVGSESPNVAVIAENLENGAISGQRTGSDGLYEIRMRARVGDQVAMYYMKQLEMSDTRYFEIPKPPEPEPGLGSGGNGGESSTEAGAGFGGSGGDDAGASGGGSVP